MTFSFNVSLSGLNANANALNVAGNNIANSNTLGYRSSMITFADVFSSSRGVRLNGAGNNLQIGNGVRTAAIHTNFDQGNLVESTSPYHVSIQGNGFFMAKNIDGSAGYTRAGDFSLDRSGYMVTPSGAQVQGYLAVDGEIPDGAQLTSMKIPIGQTLPPKVTTEATLRMNLNAEASTGAIFNAPVTVFDTRGNGHGLDMQYVRLADGTFDMTANLDGTPVQFSVNGGAPSAGPVNFQFDANGQLTSPTSLSVIPDQTALGGASLPAVEINLREVLPDGSQGDFVITGYALQSAVASTQQDGFSPGELTSASVDANGVIFGIFSNGQSRAIGQFALATFDSNAGLARVGNNMFGETITSGQPTIGYPGNGGRGLIAGGYLENSNVDLSNEFVELIEAQRGFQANSRVITSLNQTFQDLLQIV